MPDFGYQQGMGDASVGYAKMEPTEETAFFALSTALDRSRLLAQRVNQLADRLVGTVPTPVQGGVNSSQPAAVFPMVKSASYEAAALINDALIALDRIERALP